MNDVSLNNNDIDEMLERLEDVKSKSSDTSKAKVTRRLSFGGTDVERVSVLELSDPSGVHSDGSYFILIRELLNNIEELSSQNNYKSKKINKIHHDLLLTNKILISIDNSLHIHNLIELYVNGIISEDEFYMKYAETKKED